MIFISLTVMKTQWISNKNLFRGHIEGQRQPQQRRELGWGEKDGLDKHVSHRW
jgi:hypothetical protein